MGRSDTIRGSRLGRNDTAILGKLIDRRQMDSIKRLLSAPFRNTVWGLLFALSFMTIFAVSLVPPNVDGVKFTVRVRLAPAPKNIRTDGAVFV